MAIQDVLIGPFPTYLEAADAAIAKCGIADVVTRGWVGPESAKEIMHHIADARPGVTIRLTSLASRFSGGFVPLR